MSRWPRNFCKLPGTFSGRRRSPRLTGLHLVSKASTSAVITTKEYAKLPRTRVLSDGELAPPLDAYLGGLDFKKTDSVISSSTESANDTSIGDSPKKPRKSRNTKVNEVKGSPGGILLKKKGCPLRKAALIRQFKERKDELAPSSKMENAPTPRSASKVGRPRKTATLLEEGSCPPTGAFVGVPVNDNFVAKMTRPSRRRRVLSKEPEEEETPTGQPRNTLAVEILENLSKFPHCILLTRVGQFYESYFDQAEDVSRLLNIKLTSRGWSGQRVPMCGFPIVQLNKYLKVLVQQHNRFVAMCEEFMKDPLQGPVGGYDRRVVRVVTPGTLIDEPFLNPYENNYLLSVGVAEVPHSSSRTVGLAWIDVSTGEFFTKDSDINNLRDELARVAPREVVLDKDLTTETSSDRILQAIVQEGFVVSHVSPSAAAKVPPGAQTFKEQSSADDLTSLDEGMPSAFSPYETAAIKLLTSFLNDNLMESMPQLPLPSKEAVEGRMQIDAHTVKALEIREGMREGGTAGSLLSVIKRTVTSGGTRLLARWLCSPSTSIAEIHARQSLVAFFHARPHIRDDLTQLLSNIEDATRIVQKFLLGRGDLSDLSAINRAISVWNSIQKRIELERTMEMKERGVHEGQWASLDSLMTRMNDLTSLSFQISTSITRGDPLDVEGDELEEVLAPSIPLYAENTLGMKWSIKSDFSDELSDLHGRLRDMLLRKENLQRELQNDYNAASLTLRSSPSQGMFVHIGRTKRDAVKIKSSSSFTHLSETGTTSTFFYQEWSKLGAQIVETTYAIHVAEKQAFDSLRSEVNMLAGQLRRNARIIDELDVTLAFANLAVEMNFSRPQVTDDTSYQITNGRHPTVELGLLNAGRLFTPNTVALTPSSHLHIITGPNMAGKSTFLRQTALIAILAQTGSFVPADSTVIGIVDRLFTRVGAKDDLFRDRSTFMVEMLETSEILKRATPKSLVIMDEVGRGTTVEDGLAIAFATVHHLSSVKCRALFATHFHELADMLGQSECNRGQGYFQNIGFFCTGVDETDDGYFAYSYRLKPGVNRDSHGLKVAQLAGMPEPSLKVAEAALAWLKQRRKATDIHRADDLKTLGQFLAKFGEINS